MNSFEICKENWRKILLGDPKKIDIADAETKNRIKHINDDAIKAWAMLKKHRFEETKALFKDVRIVESIEMTEEYNNLKAMAIGFATKGTSCFENEELLKDILWALDWMWRHYYGQAEIEDRGWRSYFQFNWYDWHVDTPSRLMDVMLIVEEYLTNEQKKNYLALFDFIKPYPNDFSSNKLEFGRLIACSGILQGNKERVLCGRDGVKDTYDYVDNGINGGQGFYSDGSYIFHTHHCQSAVYGLAHFRGALEMAAIFKNSEFEICPELESRLYDWAFNSFLPFAFKGSLMRCICGRYPEKGRTQCYLLFKCLLKLYMLGNVQKNEQLAAEIINYIDFLKKEGYMQDFIEKLTLDEYTTFKTIENKSSEYDEKNSFKAFNFQDRSVYRKKNYAVSLSMSSSRIYNYESINGRNLKGWYHGDGMLNFHTAPNGYDEVYWDMVNPYRIPGTTVDAQQRQEVSVAQRNEYLSSQDFVGSLSTGKTGVSAMQLESYHSDGKLICRDYYLESGEYGGAPAPHKSTLMAKKSYFFVNDCLVCLGADINSADDFPVYTVLQNCKQETETNGKYQDMKISVNSKEITLSNTDTNVDGIRYFNCGDVSFYLFEENSLTLRKIETKPCFFEAIWQHGISPQKADYAYAVIFDEDGENISRFAENPPVQIIRNDEFIQAVKDLSDDSSYYVFWQAGECEDLYVSKPLIAAVKNNKLYFYDPTQKIDVVEVRYKNNTFKLDLAEKIGKTYEISIKGETENNGDKY